MATKFLRPFESNPPKDTFAMLVSYVKNHAGVEEKEARDFIECLIYVLCESLQLKGKGRVYDYFCFNIRSRVTSKQVDDCVELALRHVYAFAPETYMLRECLPDYNYATMRVLANKAKHHGTKSKRKPTK